ncbi:SDR family oxidoreductase [Jiella sp. MQZ9-1]|uniref:SDR family oxidoreductase n=1 Tax=Jiella flava TaxID=2816857 RepID=A0A939JSX2_9HYPH|nr:SDR family oxidoreductase [Jiella flava]MBO0661535.1 SDR family oxidoreductase [Jiella flava]MCD2470177.1 SDR family oxidoreductase [Jiella flava]
MKRFENKRVVITGGTSGIGLATAKRIAEEGGALLLTGNSPEHIEATRRALPEAKVIANDAADPMGAPALAEAVKAHFGTIHAAFLNAGFGSFATLDDVDAEDFDRHYDLNVRGPILQTKHLDPLIEADGAIVLTGSGTAASPREDVLVYGSTKAAVRQIARSLATRFAPRKIRVNVVTPGLTETHFHDRGGMEAAAQKTYKANVAKAVPLGRLGQPEDVAAVACFLLSADAAYVTGAEYKVDGGLTM